MRIPGGASRTPVPYDEATQQALVREFGAHFSLKTVNSTIPHGGIRLTDAKRIALPYLGVRPLGPSSVPVDLMADTARNAGHFKAYVDTIVGDEAGKRGFSSAALLRAHAPLCRDGIEHNLDPVHATLRQLLIPREDGSYVAMTPVSSTGLAFMLRERIALHHHAPCESENPGRRWRRFQAGVLQIGGSKPLNVGVLAYAMTTPAYFPVPSRDPELRHALAIHHKGPGFLLRNADLADFKSWWNTCKRAARLDPARRGRLRGAERRRLGHHLRAIVQRYLAQAALAREILGRHIDDLPSPGLAEHLSPVLHGLVEGRYHPGWVRLFAQQLTQRLARHAFRRATDGTHFDLDTHDLKSFARQIERLCAVLLRPAS